MENKGFSYYVRNGFLTSNQVFSKKEFNSLKYILFQFATLFGYLSIVFAPFFSLARVKMVQRAKKDKTIHLFNSFENTDHPKKFLHSLLSIVLRVFLFIGGIVIIAWIGAIFSALGHGIDIIIDISSKKYLYTYLLVIPAFILLIFFIIYFLIYTAPCSYFINKYGNMSGSHALNYGFNTMKKMGKATLAGIEVLQLFLNILVIGIIIGSAIGLFKSVELVSMLIEIGLIIIISLVYLLVFPRINLAFNIAKYDLYTDIENVDPNLKFDVTEDGTNVCLSDNVDEENALLDLFNQTEEKEK